MIETAVTTERKLCSPASVRVRKARLSDVNAMHRIINYYADRQLMLPKSHLQLYENLRDYSVATDTADDSTVLGCGGLHLYWESARKCVGTTLVEQLLEEARSLGLEQVFVFTYVPGFFGRFGFVAVEHRSLPLKVYNECFHCPKFNTCDEVAMVLPLS